MPVMNRYGVLAVLGALWLAGCAAGLQYTSEKTYPPRGTAAEVKIFEKVEPPEPYERIGKISWDYQRRKFEPPRLKEIEGEIKQKAWEAGGDAVIVRTLDEPREAEGVLRLSADVVRFRR
jgi:hypothetical protein